MIRRAVIKFGGADLSNPERIRQAALMVIQADYEEKIVVVSALGQTTNDLIEVIEHLKVEKQDYAEIVSMGERTSARIFSSALRANGHKSIYFDPSHVEFPIITNSQFLNAQPDMIKTNEQIEKYLEPLLKDTIPVVCGFLGHDYEGKVTTLGRGGSDTTAVILASCLQADDIILVKDINGLLSADPKFVPNAKEIRQISIYEMFSLANGGAKIVRAESLKYKLPEQRLLLVDFSSRDLSVIATEIVGDFTENYEKVKTIRNIGALTIIGKIEPESLTKIFSACNGEEILDISTGQKNITIFGLYNDISRVIRTIYQSDLFTAITFREKISKIEVIHPKFIDNSGWVAKLTTHLASMNINLIEITTSKAAINLFVEDDYCDDALKIMEEIFCEI
ncbi:MAG: aspartate kinase [Candidatus Heimdallarchaeota archaeon]|nr:aspartate kinase [Candidatus Heimdallarchaeota archaeon]